MVFMLLGLFIAQSPADAYSAYDFRGPLEVDSTLSFTVDDFTVTAAAFSGGSASYLSRSVFGLGVSSWLLDNPQIDGIGRNDTLVLTFPADVILKSASFTLMGLNDDFRLLNGSGVSLLTADIPDDGYFDFTTILPESARTGSVFGFTVAGWNDDYMLAGIEVTQIPVPPAIVLLCSGLMGLIGIRRRFKG
jgi:hypothetical protein